MGFWSNVESELKYQGISRKELSFQTGISYSGIGLGIERDSMPGADTALKISQALNVSIEYLLFGNSAKKIKPDNTMETLYKYKSIIKELDSLPANIKHPIIEMIHRLSSGLKNEM